MNEVDVRCVTEALECDMPGLTATDIQDALVLHSEAICDGSFRFLGVFDSVEDGVREAASRGAQEFQANHIPFQFGEGPPGYYIYFR